MERPPSRLAVCMHEAGHAVVQLADPPSPRILWIGVDGLDEGMLGRVETRSLWQPYMTTSQASADAREMWSVLAWRDIIFYLAGPIAELRWRYRSNFTISFAAKQMAERCLGDDPPGEDTDFGRVRRRLQAAIAGDDRANFIRAWDETAERVATWWREIQQFGRALDERGRLDEDEVIELWAAASSRRGRRKSRTKEANQ